MSWPRWRGPALLAVLCVPAIAVGVFAVGAWACVPQPLVFLQPRASGPAGTRVNVEALAVGGAAEIRWNGPEGELLGKATGPEFSQAVVIPDSPEGLYTVVVLQRAGDGSLGSTGRAAFLVTGADGSVDRASPASTTGRPAGSASGPSSNGISPGVVAAAGASLLLLGGLGGARVSRLRRAGGTGGGSPTGTLPPSDA